MFPSVCFNVVSKHHDHSNCIAGEKNVSGYRMSAVNGAGRRAVGCVLVRLWECVGERAGGRVCACVWVGVGGCVCERA